MFDITPLEIMQGGIFLLSLLAKGGLIALVPLIVDQIVSHASGHHIIPLVLAAITAINLSNLRYVGMYQRKNDRPKFYSGRRRMSMSPERIKARMQKEIDAVYDEAWFHNLNMDFAPKREGWNWI